ncbi:SOS response-associated peptidase [Halomonas cupida]|nr:SOS response-associated peptidase [Halomonas cupida]
MGCYPQVMCGRYNINDMPSLDELRIILPLLEEIFTPARRFNVAPGTSIPAVFLPDPEAPPQLDLLWWGYRPEWAGDNAPQPINAKAETVATSRYFKGAFSRHRCLVPANGWYEWITTDHGKQPHYITRTDNRQLWFAGIWARRADDKLGCAIITEPARGPARDVHDRMPLCLTDDSLSLWLDPDLSDRETIRRVVKHVEADVLTHWPVSQRIGNVKNDDASLIEPVSP